MELTVYRQATKTRPSGTIVYKGEDALPYINDQLLMVADGLGGSAAIYHQKVKTDLFDSEKLMDVLFAGVYDDYGNEEFVRYVQNSFFEFFAVKDCYTESLYNVKKSGYFASRLVTAIVLHEALYSEEYKSEVIFSKLAACETEEAKSEYLIAIGAHFKKLIQTNLRKIAKNANLIYESSFEKLDLLGTTLCATFYREKEDGVEAVYLTAGDSRPYVWTEETGLSQVLADQERSDGGMTNTIRANEGMDFSIACNYSFFKKPCVLFNTSDGCFDSGKFKQSQMAFEKLILESTAQAANTEEISGALTDFFKEWGRHDDSSTIAMKMFGYESFEGFKTACSNRMAVLNAEYLDQMEGLLETDYVSVYEEFERVLPKKLASMKEKFSTEKGVLDYCAGKVKEGQYAPYQERIAEIDEEINSIKAYIEKTLGEISEVVLTNYVRFKTFISTNDTPVERIQMYAIEKVEKKHQKAVADYQDKLNRMQSELVMTTAKLKMLLEEISAVGTPTSFEDYSSVSLQFVAECEAKMNELLQFMTALRDKKERIVKTVAEARQEYLRKNRELGLKNTPDIQQICQMLLKDEIPMSEVDILDCEKATIARSLSTFSDLRKRIDVLEEEAKNDALKTASMAYWDRHYVDVILAVLDDPKCAISKEVAEEAQAIIFDFRETSKDAKAKSDQQKELLAKYEITYGMYLGGNQ